MAQKYYAILTNIGRAKIANAIATDIPVNLSRFAVGDGNGSEYDPVETQTALINEVYRNNLNSIKINETIANQIICEGYIASNIGGFSVVEVGIFDTDGDMIAIVKYPKTYKPTLDEGAGKDLYVKVIIDISNTAAVTLKIDPSVVLASIKYVDEKFESVKSASTAIGDIIKSFRLDTPEGCVRLNGNWWSFNVFPDFVNNFLFQNKFLTCTESEYETYLAEQEGNCSYFVIDEQNQRFRVPTLANGAIIAQAQSNDEIGKFYGDAIRNITGIIKESAGNKRGSFGYGSGSGALEYFQAGAGNNSAVSEGTAWGFSFDASRVVPTADKNMVEHIRFPYFIRLATADMEISEVVYENLVGEIDILKTNMQNIKTFKLPNYSTGIDLAWNTEHTADEDCFVIATASLPEYTAASFAINGAVVNSISYSGGGGGSKTYVLAQLEIKAGLRFSASGANKSRFVKYYLE